MGDIAKRKLVYNKVKRLGADVFKHDTTPLTAHQLKLFNATLTAEETKFFEIQDGLIKLCVQEEDLDIQEREAIIFENMVQKIKLKLMEIQDALQAVQPNPVIQPQHHAQDIRLPRIELPTFDGDYNNWVPFRDMFVAMVHSSTLSGAKKLQYLKSSLKGDAANLIQSIQISDHHYDQAWEMIQERYNNKREIVASILNRLFSQPIIMKESAAALQRLLDTTNECRRSLTVQERPVDQWDDVLVHLIVERMDPETRRRWAMELKTADLPTYKELSKFLEQHIRGLLAGGQFVASTSKQHFNQHSTGRKLIASHQVSTPSSSSACPVCNRDHAIYRCDKFLALSVKERSNLVKRSKLCFNCLKSSHNSKECKSEHSCRKCSVRHNTLLHMERLDAAAVSHGPSPFVSMYSSHASEETQVLLATAIVKVRDTAGALHDCRILMDSGSQASFISEACVTSLGLSRTRSNVSVTGIGSSAAGVARGRVHVVLKSRINSTTISVDAFILSKVTHPLPRNPCATTWNHIRQLKLADPSYHQPGPIEILLGADHVAAVMRSGRRVGPNNAPIPQETIFGWILSGQVSSHQAASTKLQVNVASCETDAILRRFWEIEEMPAIRHLTAKEQHCEKHFADTHCRDAGGRYVVSLPFNNRIQDLGQSRWNAVHRLMQIERRLASQPQRKHQYVKFMQEFQQLGHMELIPEEQLSQPQGKFYYLPHHCVIKDSSTTTKLRVVFDGSCKSSSGLSLNDCLMAGPTIQDELYTLLLRFRTHLVALKADISKMYRQVKVTDQDADYQRLVWRESPDAPIQDFRLLRVTYGTAAAPYLATKCLQQLSEDECHKFPTAATILAHDFYVDDLLSGESTRRRAIELQQQLCSLLRCAGMELCKWSSNDADVLQAIPPEQREVEAPLALDPESTTKALGVQWHPITDTFQFHLTPLNTMKTPTKRACLSELAKVFDPLGFLSPTTIIAKILFQELWKSEIGWDEALPEDIQRRWLEYTAQLEAIKLIKISRCLITPHVISQQLHGFSDASEKAYAAVLYLRCELSDGAFTSRLITAKTKVAPIKQISLPRLELCGALIMAKLMCTVRKAINFTGTSYAWTDSTIVLQWLAALPGKWKTFVANRVAEIQELTSTTEWHHVKGEENPADCASRGITASELKNFDLWWRGPDWLRTATYPVNTYSIDPELGTAETRKQTVLCTQTSINIQIGDFTLLEKYSNLAKLKRVTAYVFRFFNNMKRDNVKMTGDLTVDELHRALQHWICSAQETAFSDEIRKLKTKAKVKPTSKLLTLAPFLDATGVLRVGGRIQKSDLAEAAKHQIILPYQHQLTKLIIRDQHLSLLHAGPQLLLSTLQQQYWIPRGRDAVRWITRNCVVCRRIKAKTTMQFMGNLPSARVTPSRPFLRCGLDYAGPVPVKILKMRGQKQFKAYICIFVCLSTKAIHLEAVSDLTTDAFIAALQRFSSRRGRSSDLYSDCGTNFVGADVELKRMLQQSSHNSRISTDLAERGTRWHFNPPGAPHQGGLWEAGVKSVKYHLRRVMGNVILNFEELQTLLCQIEACLNSRPLCALSSDPLDFTALTPGHFLIGEPLTAVPVPDLTDVPVNRLSRWQLQQQSLQHFWRRWRNEYLTSLQQRFQWTSTKSNIHINDMVLIKDETLPPTKWKLGRVIITHPGDDDCVRVVTVKTAKGELQRPITKLCVLLESQDNDTDM